MRSTAAVRVFITLVSVASWCDASDSDLPLSRTGPKEDSVSVFPNSVNDFAGIQGQLK